MSSAQKIIFLDKDGPIIPHIYYEAYGSNPPSDPKAVRLISKIAEAADAKIVISAQARLAGQPKCLLEFINFGFNPEIFHEDWATPQLDTRLNEIRAWLKMHPEVTHWTAIDDESLDTDNLAMCCPLNGFLTSTYEKASVLLGLEDPKLSDIFYWKARLGFEGSQDIKETDEVKNTIAHLRIPNREP